MDKYILIYYGAYIPITIFITFWVGHVLFKNGRVFLLDITKGNADLADSINKLLLTGFYLINIGYTLSIASYIGHVDSARDVMELLTVKIGTISLMLGVIHYINIFVLYRMRKRILQEVADNRFYNMDAETDLNRG